MVPGKIILSSSHPGQIRPFVEDGRATFYWGPPPSDGGSAILSYTLSCTAASITQTYGPTVFAATVTGLTNGTEYLFTISATNADGTGPATEFRAIQPGLRPGAPQNIAVTANSSTTCTVTWTAPESNGGATIKWYVIIGVSDNPADPTIKLSANGTDRLRYVTDLNASSTYTFTVFAVNDPGYGPGVSPATAIVESGLLVWLDASDYSGSGTWYDKTSNHYDATKEVGTIAKNAAGNGIVLNGSTSWQFANIGFQSHWTISVWYKSITPRTAACIVTHKNDGTPTNSVNMFIGYGLDTPTQFNGGQYYDDAYSFRIGTGVTLTNTWQNMVVTYDGTNMVTYLDNVQQGSVARSPAAGADTTIGYRIGAGWADLSTPPYLTGEIGQVLIYNRALTSGEVTYNYNGTAATY